MEIAGNYCPYHIIVDPIQSSSLHDLVVTARYHLEWLEENDITGFQWDWNDKKLLAQPYGKSWFDSSARQYLRFGFESEHDKLLFALRWA